MAVHKEPDLEQMVQCCYNKSHFVLKHRLQTHLCKCRKQYGSSVLSMCPFNSTHNVYAPELQFHIETCPDRRKLESYLYVANDPSNKDAKLPDVQMPVSSENWDEQPECTSYLDEKEKILSNVLVLREPHGQSRSFRKRFYMEEVRKFNALQSESEHLQKAKSSKSSISTTEKSAELSDENKTSNFEEIRIGMGRGMKVELGEMEKISSPSRPNIRSSTLDDLENEEGIFDD